MAAAQVGTLAKTGEVCPESGVWAVVGTPTTTAPIAKGNRMPPYNQKAVTLAPRAPRLRPALGVLWSPAAGEGDRRPRGPPRAMRLLQVVRELAPQHRDRRA